MRRAGLRTETVFIGLNRKDSAEKTPSDSKLEVRISAMSWGRTTHRLVISNSFHFGLIFIRGYSCSFVVYLHESG